MSAVLGNAGCTLLIAITKSYYILILTRFINGIFLAFFTIFNPVWIDQFAPKTSNSILMSFRHLESIIGTVLGFLLTSQIANFVSWRYSFFIQSILLICLFFSAFLISKILFNRNIAREKDTENFVLIEKLLQDEEKEVNGKIQAENNEIFTPSAVMVGGCSPKRIYESILDNKSEVSSDASTSFSGKIPSKPNGPNGTIDVKNIDCLEGGAENFGKDNNNSNIKKSSEIKLKSSKDTKDVNLSNIFFRLITNKVIIDKYIYLYIYYFYYNF